MKTRETIQDWTGKRINWAGDEYQIDTVFNEVRYLNPERIEHNASEVSYKCGHVFVLTDEAVESLNEWCVAGINDTVCRRTREEWDTHMHKVFCPECRKSRIPEDSFFSHLMPSDPPEAY
ncbi:hypothetical protein LCGC14_1879140 [marine sediment metagenome]|uniref:Uncharacterized protein n=1 Tax=marine sediment metagenome TaxID=412755 RepID=A0A0F9G2R5_9ZZZZ